MSSTSPEAGVPLNAPPTSPGLSQCAPRRDEGAHQPSIADTRRHYEALASEARPAAFRRDTLIDQVFLLASLIGFIGATIFIFGAMP